MVRCSEEQLQCCPVKDPVGRKIIRREERKRSVGIKVIFICQIKAY